jgi:hypothetical protein
LAAEPISDWTGPEHLPGAALSRDIASGEKVEAELDQFISKRHRDRVTTEGERAVEEFWRETERRVEAARRAEEGQSRLRASQVKVVIARGAAEMGWSTKFETDYGLAWDHGREVWTDSGGFAYDDGKGVCDAEL